MHTHRAAHFSRSLAPQPARPHAHAHARTLNPPSPSQAIKCYEAALATQADPPRVEAAARLATARLMLAHTGCTAEATHHLERARLALEGARGGGAALALKLHVASDLAACQAASGAARAAYATLDAAAAAAALALPPGSPAAVAWHVHFLTALGAAAAAAGDAPTAARIAARAAAGWADPEAAAGAGVGPLDRACLALAAAGTAASAGLVEEAEAAATAALAALDEVDGGEGGGETGAGAAGAAPTTCATSIPGADPAAEAAWAAALRLQAETLRVALALGTGEMTTLCAGMGTGATDAIADGLAAMAGGASAAAAAAATASPSAAASGPPASTVAAIVVAASAAAAGVLRPLAKFGPATVHALRGLAAADDELRRLGVLGSHFAPGAKDRAAAPPPPADGEGGGEGGVDPDALAPEASVAPHIRAAAAPLIRARLLLLEARARAALASTDLAAGRAHAAAALALADAWPCAAGPLVPALLELAGHYALCTRAPAEAARLFSLASARAGAATGAAAAAASSAAAAPPGGALPPPPPPFSPATLSPGVAGPVAGRVMAGSLAALAELADPAHDRGGPTARANAALKAAGVLPSLPPGLPRTARTVARLASGAALLAAGDAPAARVALSAALASAQTEMANSCLIGVVLVALAPSQAARGDLQGAEGMLEAAFTLAKGALDVATVVSAALAKASILAATTCGGGGAGTAAADGGGSGEDSAALLAQMGAFADRKEAALAGAVATAVGLEAEHGRVVGWGGA